MTVQITKDNFETAVLQSEKPVILDFWAEWCGPCRMMAPTLDRIAQEHSELLVGKVNVDENLELAQKFGIVSIPTLIAFRNGAVVEKTVGVQSEDDVLALLD